MEEETNIEVDNSKMEEILKRNAPASFLKIILMKAALSEAGQSTRETGLKELLQASIGMVLEHTIFSNLKSH